MDPDAEFVIPNHYYLIEAGRKHGFRPREYMVMQMQLPDNAMYKMLPQSAPKSTQVDDKELDACFPKAKGGKKKKGKKGKKGKKKK